MSEKIYRFFVREGQRTMEGLFVATDAEVEWILNKEINFGSGFQHMVVTMQPEHFTVVSDNTVFAETFAERVRWIGLTPFDYLNSRESQETLQALPPVTYY